MITIAQIISAAYPQVLKELINIKELSYSPIGLQGNVVSTTLSWTAEDDRLSEAKKISFIAKLLDNAIAQHQESLREYGETKPKGYQYKLLGSIEHAPGNYVAYIVSVINNNL